MTPLDRVGTHAGDSRVALTRLALLLALWVMGQLLPTAVASAQDADHGVITGRVFDAEAGAPIENATIILAFPDPGDGSEARQEVATSGPAGDYEFLDVPAGFYVLSFIKSGYRASSLTEFEVVAAKENLANFPMPRAQAAAADDVMELDAFVVEASVMGDMLNNLELRLDSDQMVNLLSAEDLSKYAASDVADALKRVAGVNIVEGQFAVVRGLEDRYSSTLFNGAPVPSPDPNSQSVQLDLFPSEIVTNLVLAKTFAASSPSNSAAGSIDIVTQDYPEEIELKIKVGAGFEEEARKIFLERQSGSTVGDESDTSDIIEVDVGASLGGRYPVFGRELRFKGVVNYETDNRTLKGQQEGKEPRLRAERQRAVGPPQILQSGGLALGELALSDGRFDQVTSSAEKQLTVYTGLGMDIDEEGDHRVDFSFFYTKKDNDAVEQRKNGFFPDFDYSNLIQATEDQDDLLGVLQELDQRATLSSRLAGAERALRAEVDDSPSRGALWFANFGRTNSFERDRDLFVYQMNGEHEFDILGGFDVDWAANHATTSQDDSARGMRFFYEPCGYSGQFPCEPGESRIDVPTEFPVRVSDLGPGTFFASGPSGGIVYSNNKIDESQYFGRLDIEKEIAPFDFMGVQMEAGVWWEKANRSVDAFFVENVTVLGSSQWALGSPTLQGLGSSLFGRLDPLDATRASTSRADREIAAGYLSMKMTLWEDLDLLAGVRLEDIQIESENDPFTGETQFERPVTFPPAYLFFDRLDNPDVALGGEVPPFFDPDGVTYNDQILGINTPINPDTGFVDLLTRQQILGLVNGKIDEFQVLPSVGLAYRPLDGLTLRASYSETVARPSFREMGYYVSVEPGTDDRTVGNPQLELSDVTSYDVRAEYVHGDLGDLFAFSAFYKTIEDPIESAIVRNPLDLSSGSAALYRTFFNNPDVARLWGIEVEARKSFDFLPEIGLDFPGAEIFEYLSIGGNFTYIDAKVDRSPAEISRFDAFFGVAPGDPERFTDLNETRRLFGQPEWIANADVTFDHPDWGTTVTLALFAISDVLEAAGTAALGPNGLPVSATLDRYLDEFYQLDLVASQEIWQGIGVKMSVKNLTDTTRRRVYDRKQTRGKFTERKWNWGRDWSFSVTYAVEF